MQGHRGSSSFWSGGKDRTRENSRPEPSMGFLNLSLLGNSRGTAILEGTVLQVTGQSVESSGCAVFQ